MTTATGMQYTRFSAVLKSYLVCRVYACLPGFGVSKSSNGNSKNRPTCRAASEGDETASQSVSEDEASESG